MNTVRLRGTVSEGLLDNLSSSSNTGAVIYFLVRTHCSVLCSRLIKEKYGETATALSKRGNSV